MLNDDKIFYKIAETLIMDYSSVYYVDALTDEYKYFSVDPEFHSLNIETKGDDFFKNVARDAVQVVYEDDIPLIQDFFTKEKLLSDIKAGGLKNIQYRLMIDGEPVYHTIRLIRGADEHSDYFLIGVLNIDKQVRMEKEAERFEKQSRIYNQIAEILAARYDTIYYIDLNTNDYFEYSSSSNYQKLNIAKKGVDFFEESRRNIRKYVHPDDREFVLELHYKENILKKFENKKAYNVDYRLIIDDEITNISLTAIIADDKNHLIICIENIDDKVKEERAKKEFMSKSFTYGQIAETLAAHYDVIYYVDAESGEYKEFTANQIFGSLEIQEEGVDFFTEAQRNAEQVIAPRDMEKMKRALTKENLLSSLEEKKQFVLDYRLIIDGALQYTRMTAMWASDKLHIIIGVENVTAEVAKEKERERTVNIANKLARRDELTGVKNRNAFKELENQVESEIFSGACSVPFGLVVADINGLKRVNDVYGHKAGDEYIKSSCELVCKIFTHSPVFRIGGDEFVVFIKGSDYENRDELLAAIKARSLANLKEKRGPVVAIGAAVYEPDSDASFMSVFERADVLMYENKNKLKELDDDVLPKIGDIAQRRVPEERIKRIDILAEAFSAVSGGSYIFVCDMIHDYSKWSKAAVDLFGLPSEYMFEAGKIWESHIHPDDVDAYRKGIEGIFRGESDGHDMQYRARKLNGEYDVCTCHGVVMRNSNGIADFFCGAITNHGVENHFDRLTGLRNLYGFFEDLETNILKHNEIRLAMVGLRDFSDVNEVYGYQFGNLVLQKLGRYLYETVGNTGCVYRLDGVRFAILSKKRKIPEMMAKYEEFRNFLRQGVHIDDKYVNLDANAGYLSVDNFDIDFQTVYSCLNFAYGESKQRKQGDPVEFYNDLNDENKRRIEKLHAIRGSITQNYSGFYLLYQPVVDAATENVIGAEALLRWKNDEYGIVPPDSFIPILEKDPLFSDLGKWILQSAISGAKKLIEKYPELVVNVNISYTQLEKPNFEETVFTILKENDFPPEKLCLEITERCRLLDMTRLKNAIINLRGKGVRIALDDFGTGFSSIGLVRALPFDTIKIDRSFVMKIEEDPKERAIIKSLSDLAATYGFKVCVEGIETPGMRDILLNYYVHSFQGYYYSKPVSVDDFLKKGL